MVNRGENVFIDNPALAEQERQLLSRAYLERLEAYSEATGGELKLAVYWAKWAIWTLVSPKRLLDENGNLRLNMMRALMANEMGELGDRMIGTRPPLRLLLFADPEKTPPIGPDGRVLLNIGGVKAFCGENEILDPMEQELAWVFMQHGQWEEQDSEVEIEGDKLKSIEIRWEPGQKQNEGFEIVGTLSRMFARYFAEMTVDEDEVIQVRAPMRPGWFAALVSAEHQYKDLPLWKFILQANYEDEA